MYTKIKLVLFFLFFVFFLVCRDGITRSNADENPKTNDNNLNLVRVDQDMSFDVFYPSPLYTLGGGIVISSAVNDPASAFQIMSLPMRSIQMQDNVLSYEGIIKVSCYMGPPKDGKPNVGCSLRAWNGSNALSNNVWTK